LEDKRAAKKAKKKQHEREMQEKMKSEISIILLKQQTTDGGDFSL
jgi:hypothetical protein